MPQELPSKSEALTLVRSHGYKVVTRREFDASRELPPGLRERAEAYEGNHVVYDPDDDAEGYMLVGDDAGTLAIETVEHLELGSDTTRDRRSELSDFFRSDEMGEFVEANCVGASPWQVLVDVAGRLVVQSPDNGRTYGVFPEKDGFNVRAYDDGPLQLLDPEADEIGDEIAASLSTVEEAFAAVLEHAGLTPEAPRM